MAMRTDIPATRPSLLVRLADSSDDAAWRSFHEIYGPLVYNHCRRRGVQHADAAEITQDVLIDVVRAIPEFRYDRSKGRFRAWLGTLTYRRLCRFWRRRRSELAAVASDSAWLAESLEDHRADWNDDVDAHLLRQAMDRVSRQVDPTTWEAFVRVWLRDEPAGEVATAMRRDAAWVYVAKSRVLKRLRHEVEQLMHDLALE